MSNEIAVAPAAMTIRVAVAYSGLSRTRLYAELGAGRLQAVRAGRRTLVLRESLDTLIAGMPRATFGPPKPATA